MTIISLSATGWKKQINGWNEGIKLLFLKKHYEKILLGTLLIIFIVLLIFQFLLWQQGQKIKIDGILEFTPPPPNYTSIDFEAQDSPFNVLANLAETPQWLKSEKRLASSVMYTDFMLPYPMAFCPYCRKMIPAVDFPPVNSDREGHCSLCRHVLKAPLRNKLNIVVDTDEDGIPDKEELALGMNPKDPTDAAADFDDDGFTNYEEFIAGTKIRDAKSRPPYHQKISVVNVSKTVLPITIKLIDFKGKDDKNLADVQIGIRDRRGREKSHYLKLGKAFNCTAGTFTVVDIIRQTETVTIRGTNTQAERDNSYVILQKRGSKDRIEAHLKSRVTEPREKIVLRFGSLKRNQEKEFYAGDSFELGTQMTGTEKYTIAASDAQKKTVDLKFEQDGKTYTISRQPQIALIIEQKRAASQKQPPQQRIR